MRFAAARASHNRGPRSAAAIATAAALAAFLAPSAFARDVSANALAKKLVHGAVDWRGVHVRGVLHLGGLEWQHPFVCRGCTFDGVSGRRATFTHIVDLSGSTFTHPVDLSETTFDAPALFGPLSASPGARQADFKRGADFSLATFGDLADFESAVFDQPVDFSLARFDGQAVFAQGRASGAHFERAVFSGTADFGAYVFTGSASFANTTSFADATFSGRTDFSQTTFAQPAPALFDRARFDHGATFQSATFGVNPDGSFTSRRGDPFSFSSISSGGGLDFTYATFVHETNFTNVQADGPLSFVGATFDTSCIQPGNVVTTRCVDFTQVSTTELDMAVSDVRHAVVDSEQPRVLAMIEAGAKEQGDLTLANDAHYELKLQQSRTDSGFEHLLDFVFYRTIAGYFVRPLNPLFVLFAAVALMSLIRTWRHRPTTAPSEAPEAAPVTRSGFGGSRETARAPRAALARRGGRRLGLELGVLTHETLDTLGLVVRQHGEPGERTAQRVEAFGYRLLVVLILLGFANSNPTLRQMFDALR